ncbi:MAG: hypothetical protein RIE77_05640 [Phycisphaerales bacterium]|jgi:hypothetical protein
MTGRPLAVACSVLAASFAFPLERAHGGDPVLVVTTATFGSTMLYSVDPNTGEVVSAVELIGTGTTGRTPLAGLARDGTGTILGFTPSADNEFYRVDALTGRASRGGRLGLSAREGGVAVFADGTIMGASTGSPGRLFTINPSTGRASRGPTMSPATDISGLDVRADGLLIGLDLRGTDGPPSIRAIDPDTGETIVLADLAATGSLDDAGGLAILDGAEKEVGYYVVSGDGAGDQAELWRFDPYTGQQSFVGVLDGVSAVSGMTALPCAACPADLDADCQATIFDLILLGNWIEAGDLRGDVNGDGVIDLFDFLFFFDVLERGC